MAIFWRKHVWNNIQQLCTSGVLMVDSKKVQGKWVYLSKALCVKVNLKVLCGYNHTKQRYCFGHSHITHKNCPEQLELSLNLIVLGRFFLNWTWKDFWIAVVRKFPPNEDNPSFGAHLKGACGWAKGCVYVAKVNFK